MKSSNPFTLRGSVQPAAFLALLLTYVIVRPTGYSPRFSTPLVVISLLALADGHIEWGKKRSRMAQI